MNRKRVAKIAIFLFLVQSLTTTHISAETFALNPPIKVSLTESENSFKQVYAILGLANIIYRLDAFQRCSKEAVKETILRDYLSLLEGVPELRFDLDNIDKGKKGWTRYYPFSIGEKSYIIRIFLTEEYAFQPKIPVLFELAVKNPAITFQILPSVNSILADCKIKPYRVTSPAKETETYL